jgi:hypothetical protein
VRKRPPSAKRPRYSCQTLILTALWTASAKANTANQSVENPTNIEKIGTSRTTKSRTAYPTADLKCLARRVGRLSSRVRLAAVGFKAAPPSPRRAYPFPKLSRRSRFRIGRPRHLESTREAFAASRLSVKRSAAIGRRRHGKPRQIAMPEPRLSEEHAILRTVEANNDIRRVRYKRAARLLPFRAKNAGSAGATSLVGGRQFTSRKIGISPSEPTLPVQLPLSPARAQRHDLMSAQISRGLPTKTRGRIRKPKFNFETPHPTHHRGFPNVERHRE